MAPGMDGGWGEMYMDGRKVYERGTYHTTSNGGLSDDYSGLDSGQGSSLDRKYDTFGRSSYNKVRLYASYIITIMFKYVYDTSCCYSKFKKTKECRFEHQNTKIT